MYVLQDMENESKFTPITLLNSLRESLNIHKEKFSCEDIQILMNTIEDLEYEIHLLHVNYEQNEQNTKLLKNILESLQNNKSNHSPQTNKTNQDHDQDQHQDSDLDSDQDSAEEWADHIATLVVQKIAAME